MRWGRVERKEDRLEQCYSNFFGHGTLFSLKKSRGTPTAESVKKRKSVAYIDSIKLFSSKCR